jgi:hypothetical protein
MGSEPEPKIQTASYALDRATAGISRWKVTISIIYCPCSHTSAFTVSEVDDVRACFSLDITPPKGNIYNAYRLKYTVARWEEAPN